MSSQPATDNRKVALEAFLADYESRGFRLESRTDTQAILVRRPRLARLARRGGNRIVIWVDEHGAVESRPIEARRW